MPRIRCHYHDCIFLDEGYCSAAAVEIDQDTGCATYSPSDSTDTESDWEENDDNLDGWDQEEFEDEDDLWLDDDEDF